MTPEEAKRGLQAAGVHGSYTIAFSVRCGSTVLSQTLESLGVGHATEYFQYPYEAREYFAAYPASDVTQQFLRLVAGQAQGGVFGSKMSHDHRAHIDAHLERGIEGYRKLDDVLPRHRWIFMRRRDLVAQALSWYLAEATERWHIPTGATDPIADEIPYDFFDLLSKIMVLSANNANWEAYFTATGIVPHHVVYEDLVADANRELAKVLRYLDIERDVGQIDLERESGLQAVSKAAAPTYARLKNRFLADFLRIGRPDDAERLGADLSRWNSFFFEKGWRGAAPP